jgi:hypothetical protein
MYARRAYVPAEYRSWLAARVAQLLPRHGLDRQSGGTARGVTGAQDPQVRGLPGDSEGEFPAGSLPTGGMPGVAPAPKGPRPEPPPAREPEQLSLL